MYTKYICKTPLEAGVSKILDCQLTWSAAPEAVRNLLGVRHCEIHRDIADEDSDEKSSQLTTVHWTRGARPKAKWSITILAKMTALEKASTVAFFTVVLLATKRVRRMKQRLKGDRATSLSWKQVPLTKYDDGLHTYARQSAFP